MHRPLWSDLCNLAPAATSNWCLLGDFNTIKCLSNNCGGDGLWDSGMADFKACASNLVIDNIRATGPHHTWWNGQGPTSITRKLDRAMGNATWFNNFSSSEVQYLPNGLSDHFPILLCLNRHIPKLCKPFQFFNFMMDISGYQQAVSEAWDFPIHGNPLYVFSEKLKRVKHALIALNKNHGNLSSNILDARRSLHAVQYAIHSSSSTPDLRAAEKLHTHHLWSALILEAKLCK